jgi:quinol monooxygenase YgiN
MRQPAYHSPDEGVARRVSAGRTCGSRQEQTREYSSTRPNRSSGHLAKGQSMQSEISWHAELQVKPGQFEALRALTAEMVDSTKSEPGALIYQRFLSEDRQVVHVFERYSDSAAAVAHLKSFRGDVWRKILRHGRAKEILGTRNAQPRTQADPESLWRNVLCPLRGLFARAEATVIERI